MIEENISVFRKGIREVSFVLLSRLFDFSRKNAFFLGFSKYLKDVTPKPFLERVLCRYRPPGPDWIRTISLVHPDEENWCCWDAAVSNCSKYTVILQNDYVMVFDTESTKMLSRRSRIAGKSLVKFSPDASKIVFCSREILHVWNWRSRDSPMDLRGHRNSVSALQFGFYSSRLFSGSVDGTVKEWDLLPYIETRNFSFKACVRSVAVNPDFDRAAIATVDGYLDFLDWSPAKISQVWQKSPTWSLEFSQHDGRLVSGGRNEESSWRTDSWEKVSSAVVEGNGHSTALEVHKAKVFLGFSNRVNIWNLLSGEVVELHDGKYGYVSGLCPTANAGLMVAYRDGRVRTWRETMRRQMYAETESNAETAAFSLSADGTRVAELTFAGDLMIWDTSTGPQIIKYRAPKGECRRVALTPMGKQSRWALGPRARLMCGFGKKHIPFKNTMYALKQADIPLRIFRSA